MIMKIYERNMIFHTTSHINHPIKSIITRTSSDETVQDIRNARIQWEDGILEELQAIAKETRRPFLIIRLLLYI